MPATRALRRRIAVTRPDVVDRAVLRTLAQAVGDDAIVDEICALFLQETGPRLQALRAAALRGDAEALHAHTLTLKGSAASVGAVLVVDAADELDALAGSGDLAGAQAWLTRLAEALDLTRAELGRTHA
jgi:HPt (histidine-containing phosphotransfer) domain-containing protein